MSLFFSMLQAGSDKSYTIVAPNETVFADDFVSPYSSLVGIRFNADGTYDTRAHIDGAGSWVYAGDWIDPISRVGDVTAHVRFTNHSGAYNFDTLAAVEDTWIEINATRTWSWTESGAVLGSFFADFAISLDGGSTTEAVDTSTFSIENS